MLCETGIRWFCTKGRLNRKRKAKHEEKGKERAERTGGERRKKQRQGREHPLRDKRRPGVRGQCFTKLLLSGWKVLPFDWTENCSLQPHRLPVYLPVHYCSKNLHQFCLQPIKFQDTELDHVCWMWIWNLAVGLDLSMIKSSHLCSIIFLFWSKNIRSFSRTSFSHTFIHSLKHMNSNVMMITQYTYVRKSKECASAVSHPSVWSTGSTSTFLQHRKEYKKV